MDGTDIALRFVGAFYTFAGFVATRAALMSSFLDYAIAQIGMQKISTRERVQTAWLMAAAAGVFASGLALLLLLDVALWLFLISALGQAVYLVVLAPYYFDVEDPPDAKGRQGSTNAFVLYGAVTAIVIAAFSAGKLRPLASITPIEQALGTTLLAAFTWYVVSSQWKLNRPSPGAWPLASADEFDDDDQPRDWSALKRVKVMADYHCFPLWSLDGPYTDIDPRVLGLPDDLASALVRWSDAYTASLNDDDPANSHWSEDQFLTHEADGHKLAVRLKRARPDLMVYVLEPVTGVVEIHDDGAA